MTRRWLEPAGLGLAGAGVVALAMLLAYQANPALPVAAALAMMVLVLTVTRPVVGVCLAIALIPLEIISLPLGIGGLTPAEGVLVLSGWGWVAKRISEGKPPYEPSPLVKPLLVLVLAMFPGFLVAEDSAILVKTLLMWTSIFFVYQAVTADAGPREVRMILYALAFAGAAVATVAVVKSGGGADQQLISGGRAEGRAIGTFTQPNLLGTFLAMTIPGALVLGLKGRPSLRPAALVALAVTFAGLALSLSRGGVIAALGALAVLLWWRPARRFAVGGFLVVALLTVLGGNPLGNVQQVNTVLQRLSTVDYTTRSGEDPRFMLWRTTPGMIIDHPLIGVGGGQFDFHSRDYGMVDVTTGETFIHAHNVVLTVGAELGIIGLFGLFWLAGSVLLTVIEALRRQRGPNRGITFAVAASLGAMAMAGIVDYTVRSNVIGATAIILAACAVVLARAPTGADGSRQPVAR